jgi:hypothetical protein
VKKDLWQLNLEQLEALYSEESKKLETRLLSGASWDEVLVLRQTVGELSTVIYKKLNPAHFGHPAEQARRGVD